MYALAPTRNFCIGNLLLLIFAAIVRAALHCSLRRSSWA